MCTYRSFSTRRSRHSTEVLVLARSPDRSHENHEIGISVGIIDDELVTGVNFWCSAQPCF